MSKVVDSLQSATSIPFPEFNAALIEGVFDTVLSMNIKQTEQYIMLVKEVSKTLTTYINDTVDDVAPMEIIDLLSSLPPIDFAPIVSGNAPPAAPVNLQGLLTSELTAAGGTPPAAPSAEVQSMPASALNALNKQMDIPGIINAGSSAVVDITGAISKAANSGSQAFKDSIGAIMENGKMIAYDPVKFEMTNPALTAADMAAISMGKIYDAIAANVCANKYALLQEMVKLGMVRIVVDNGLIEAAMTFESVTTEVTETTQELKDSVKTKSKYKQNDKTSKLKKIFKGNDKNKSKSSQKTINISTYKERHLNSQTERGSLMGRSVIHWHTDYVPVREA